MPKLAPVRFCAVLLAVTCLPASGGSVAARQAQPGDVQLLEPVEMLTASPPMLAGKLARLARIDATKPIDADRDGQTLSMFGREDLIASSSDDYQPTSCRPLAGAHDVLGEIDRRARTTSIVIINESHERSRHRGFIAQVAQRLRSIGYGSLAMETLTNNPAETPAKYLPTFIKQPDLSYFVDGDGMYLSEPAFGRLGRLVKALGYRLVPYELNDYRRAADMTAEQRIAVREEAQAENLATYLRAHPGTKLLVHVGYSHAAEVPRRDGARWMATRLKEKTGIDPLTISQTYCRGGGEQTRLSALPASEPPGTVDLVVDHPTERFVNGRPAWRRDVGDRAVPVPARLRPTEGWRVVEARPDGEPVASVPIDRVAIRPGEDMALMLPPGRYRLRVIDVKAPALTLEPES